MKAKYLLVSTLLVSLVGVGFAGYIYGQDNNNQLTAPVDGVDIVNNITKVDFISNISTSGFTYKENLLDKDSVDITFDFDTAKYNAFKKAHGDIFNYKTANLTFKFKIAKTNFDSCLITLSNDTKSSILYSEATVNDNDILVSLPFYTDSTDVREQNVIENYISSEGTTNLSLSFDFSKLKFEVTSQDLSMEASIEQWDTQRN